MEIGREGKWTPEMWRATREDRATIEHVIPKIAGGSNDWDNLAAACRMCNNARSAMKAEKYLQFVEWKGRIKAARYANRLRGRLQARKQKSFPNGQQQD
jgi:5-methylcytosine-specific restriction endonuclease McrA